MLFLPKNPRADDIQKLADLPYGKAQQVLIENGFWDWSKDPKRKKRKEYLVDLEAEYFDHEAGSDLIVHGNCTVWAETKEDALRIAFMDYELDEINWEFPNDNKYDLDCIDEDTINVTRALLIS